MATETDSIAKLAGETRKPVLMTTSEGREFLVTAGDATFTDVTERHAVKVFDAPFIDQKVTVQTVESLIEYVNRFKTEDTVLFADIERSSIVGAVDYHAPEKAAHVSHRATLTLPYSVEWKTWAAINGKLNGQLEFARFLEENAADIAAPVGAEVLEACRDLQAVRKVNFKKAVRTATDNETFEYSDETETRSATKGVEVPTKFLLKIPVYFGEEATELYAFLRWRLDEGNLLLGIALHRAEHVRQAVFKQLVLEAAEKTGRPAVFGSIG